MIKNISMVLRYSKLNMKKVIIILFSVLPLIDSLNGFTTELPIGIVYKIGLCAVLLLTLINRRKISSKYFFIVLFLTIYILLSISVNLALGGKLTHVDYPIKLLFNAVLLCLLLDLIKHNIMTGESIYTILENSSYVFICCFIVPYFLGVGNSVYSGGIGYKAFFISQNELGMLITVMVFFTAYKLICRNSIKDVICLSLLFLCGMLLNTKTTIIACIIAIAAWIIPIFYKSKLSVKIMTIVTLLVGIIVFRNVVISAFNASIDRYSILLSKFYNGVPLTGILSGRDIFLQNAWENLKQSNTLIKGLIGNGFCSDILIEMDLFDVFFYLGIIGLLPVIIFLLIMFRTTLKNSKQDHSFVRPLSLLVMIALFSLAGHVLFMSMSGCYFALYICFLVSYRTDYKNRRVLL